MKKKRIVISLIMTLILIVGGIILSIQSMQQQDTRTRASESKQEEVKQHIPDFPIFPGASIKEFNKREQPINSNQDLHAEWVVRERVIPVMDWYITTLRAQGWTIEEPNDKFSEGEQIAQIMKGQLSGYIAVEDDGNGLVEIVVDFKKTN